MACRASRSAGLSGDTHGHAKRYPRSRLDSSNAASWCPSFDDSEAWSSFFFSSSSNDVVGDTGVSDGTGAGADVVIMTRLFGDVV